MQKIRALIESQHPAEQKKRSWLQFKILLKPGKNILMFADRCVYCGKKKYKTIRIEKIENQLLKSEGVAVAKKTYLTYTLELSVPYCKSHYFIAHGLRFYTSAIFFAGAAAVGYPYYIFMKGYTPSGFTAGFELALILVGGLFLCAIAGGLLFLLVNFGISKVFPILSAVKFFELLALSLDIKNHCRLTLEFYNAEIGWAFAKLNKLSHRANITTLND
jgi:hypothetical protein